MSEALRKACEIEVESVRKLTDTYEEEVDRLVAFAKQQRAAVWREAAKYWVHLINTEPVRTDVKNGLAGHWEQLSIQFVAKCESQARALEA